MREDFYFFFLFEQLMRVYQKMITPKCVEILKTEITTDLLTEV